MAGIGNDILFGSILPIIIIAVFAGVTVLATSAITTTTVTPSSTSITSEDSVQSPESTPSMALVTPSSSSVSPVDNTENNTSSTVEPDSTTVTPGTTALLGAVTSPSRDSTVAPVSTTLEGVVTQLEFELGNITIVKQTDPDGSTDAFNFTGDLGNFTLTDGQNATFTVPSGVYNVTETVPFGWFNFDRSCSFLEFPQVSSCNTNPAPATIEVNLEAGGNVLVEFGNEDTRGNITIVKQTDPDGSAQAFNFTGDLGNFTLTDGQNVTFTVPSGVYNIMEIVPSGWFNFDRSCSFLEFPQVSSCNTNPAPDTIEVNLGAGGNVLVEFGNEDLEINKGTITIAKETIPDGSTQLFNFTVIGGPTSIGNFTLGDGQNVTFSDLAPGNYTFLEIVPDGWNNNERGCSGDAIVWVHDPDRIIFTVDENLVNQTIICTFTNTDVRGNITIIKETIPDGSSQLFNFTVIGGPTTIGNFTLGDGQNVTFTGLLPGNYTFLETVPDGWNNSERGCSGDGIVWVHDPDRITYTVSETLLQDQSTICTFTNTEIDGNGDQRGTITIVKQTTPDNSTQLFNFTATGGPTAIGNFTLGDGQNATFTVLPGNYTFLEIVPEGWNNSGMSCTTTGNVNTTLYQEPRVTLGVGENGTATCTFDNEEIDGNGGLGNITIIKQTIPDNSTQLFNFTGDFGNFTLGDGQNVTFTGLVPGDYTFFEQELPGWKMSIKCGGSGFDGLSAPGNNVTIFTTENANVSCTITNEDIRGTITIVKQTDPDGSPQLFNFTGDFGNFTLGDGQNVTFTGLLPGDYHVTEIIPLGWRAIDLNCSGNPGSSFSSNGTATIPLEEGNNAICEFFNEADRGTIILEKQTIPDGALGTFTFTGDIGATIGDNETITAGGLPPGNYSTTEVDPAPFILTNIACNDTNSFWNMTSRTATFVLEPGEVVKCTFTNTNVLVVDIDIKPGSDPNAINLKKDKIITVAILGNATFNVNDIDVSPLSDAPKFGGSTPKAPIRTSYKDVNGDGFTDLVLQYRLAQLGFTTSSTEGCISGKLTDGTTIEGCDSVKIVPK